MKNEVIVLYRFINGVSMLIYYFHGKVVIKQVIKTSGTYYTLLYGRV